MSAIYFSNKSDLNELFSLCTELNSIGRLNFSISLDKKEFESNRLNFSQYGKVTYMQLDSLKNFNFQLGEPFNLRVKNKIDDIFRVFSKCDFSEIRLKENGILLVYLDSGYHGFVNIGNNCPDSTYSINSGHDINLKRDYAYERNGNASYVLKLDENWNCFQEPISL